MSEAGDWSNYWDGRQASSSGAALNPAAGPVGVETDADLRAFWSGVFSTLPPDARVLDVACGAGTVLLSAQAAGLERLTGLDVSTSAIAAMVDRLPQATGWVGTVESLAERDAKFDVVTSQFGFEYGGALASAQRLADAVAPGGKFAAVLHHADGAIAEEVRAKAKAAHTIANSQFVTRAKAVFTADASEFEAAATAFGHAQDAVISLAKDGDVFAGRLYSGTQQLWTRRRAYDPYDVVAWLDGMNGELSAFIGRMDGMLAAAQSTAEIEAVTAALTTSGLKMKPPAELSLGGRVAAWVLKGDNESVT